LPDVFDQAHGEGDDGSSEHGARHHGFAAVPVRNPSPEGRKENHDQTGGSGEDSRPVRHQPLFSHSQFPDVEGQEGQGKGETDDGKQLRREHDV